PAMDRATVFELAVEHERERVKLARDEERQHDGLAGLRESLLGPPERRRTPRGEGSERASGSVPRNSGPARTRRPFLQRNRRHYGRADGHRHIDAVART